MIRSPSIPKRPVSSAEGEVMNNGTRITEQCIACNTLIVHPAPQPDEYYKPICDACYARYPDELIKAVGDPFEYAMRLTSGELIRFESAIIKGEWVHITGSGYTKYNEPVFPELPHPCPRGISVRISEIVWVADAPNSS
jgi:hypothetical protein